MSKPSIKYRIKFGNIFMVILLLYAGYFIFKPNQLPNDEDKICIEDTIQVPKLLPPKKTTRAEQLIASIQETPDKWDVYFESEYIPRSQWDFNAHPSSLRYSIIFKHKKKHLSKESELRGEESGFKYLIINAFAKTKCTINFG